jgi:hypothetical protein
MQPQQEFPMAEKDQPQQPTHRACSVIKSQSHDDDATRTTESSPLKLATRRDSMRQLLRFAKQFSARFIAAYREPLTDAERDYLERFQEAGRELFYSVGEVFIGVHNAPLGFFVGRALRKAWKECTKEALQ